MEGKKGGNANKNAENCNSIYRIMRIAQRRKREEGKEGAFLFATPSACVCRESPDCFAIRASAQYPGNLWSSGFLWRSSMANAANFSRESLLLVYLRPKPRVSWLVPFTRVRHANRVPSTYRVPSNSLTRHADPEPPPTRDFSIVFLPPTSLTSFGLTKKQPIVHPGRKKSEGPASKTTSSSFLIYFSRTRRIGRFKFYKISQNWRKTFFRTISRSARPPKLGSNYWNLYSIFFCTVWEIRSHAREKKYSSQNNQNWHVVVEFIPRSDSQFFHSILSITSISRANLQNIVLIDWLISSTAIS